MHLVNCTVSVGGDLYNKAPKIDVTVPELQLLQLIHGPSSVTLIQVQDRKPRINQLREKERLQYIYPLHIETIVGMWRDNGGKFMTDIRDLNLPPAYFAPSEATPYAVAVSMDEQDKQVFNRSPIEIEEDKPRRKKQTVKTEPVAMAESSDPFEDQ